MRIKVVFYLDLFFVSIIYLILSINKQYLPRGKYCLFILI